MTLSLETILAKLPIAELNKTIAAHVHPLVQLLPDKRLGAVVECILLGILGQSDAGDHRNGRGKLKGKRRDLADCEAHLSFFAQSTREDRKPVSRLVSIGQASGGAGKPGLSGGGG